MMHGGTPATVSAATTSATSVPFATANQVCFSPASSHSFSRLVSTQTFSVVSNCIDMALYKKGMNCEQGPISDLC